MTTKQSRSVKKLLDEQGFKITTTFEEIINTIKKESVSIENPMIIKSIQWLLSFQHENGGFKNEGEEIPSPPVTAYVLMAIVSSGIELRDDVDRAINYLLKIQNPDGSWSYYPGSRGSVGVTALVLRALEFAGFESHNALIRGREYLVQKTRELLAQEVNTLNLSEVAMALTIVSDAFKNRIEDIVEYFKKGANTNGSFGFPPYGDAETTITVYSALRKLGVDPDDKFMKNMLDFVFSMRDNSGLFKPNQFTKPKIDTTAYILLELALSGYDILNDKLLLSSTNIISQFINEDGGFPDSPGERSDVETTAIIVTAFSITGFEKVIRLGILEELLKSKKLKLIEELEGYKASIESMFDEYTMEIKKLRKKLRIYKGITASLFSLLITVIGFLIELLF